MSTKNGEPQNDYDSKSLLFTTSNSAHHNNNELRSIHITVQVHVQPEGQENYQIQCNSKIKDEERKPLDHKNEFQGRKDLSPCTSSHTGRNCPFGLKKNTVTSNCNQTISACSNISSKSYSQIDDTKGNNVKSVSVNTINNSNNEIILTSTSTNSKGKTSEIDVNADEMLASFQSKAKKKFNPIIVEKVNKIDLCNGKWESNCHATKNVVAISNEELKAFPDTFQLPQGM